MGDEREKPFDSIESTQEFMALLEASIADAIHGVEEDREEALLLGNGRRVEALDLALYKLKCLDTNVQKNKRLLNDLRSVRRLLYQERAVAVA